MVSKYCPQTINTEGGIVSDIESQSLISIDSTDSHAWAGDSIEGDYYIVKCPAVGTQTLYGLSSAYDTNYPNAMRIQAGTSTNKVELVRRDEFDRILDRANDIISW